MPPYANTLTRSNVVAGLPMSMMSMIDPRIYCLLDSKQYDANTHRGQGTAHMHSVNTHTLGVCHISYTLRMLAQHSLTCTAPEHSAPDSQPFLNWHMRASTDNRMLTRQRERDFEISKTNRRAGTPKDGGLGVDEKRHYGSFLPPPSFFYKNQGSLLVSGMGMGKVGYGTPGGLRKNAELIPRKLGEERALKEEWFITAPGFGGEQITDKRRTLCS